jgi:hypothetical protein
MAAQHALLMGALTSFRTTAISRRDAPEVLQIVPP